MSRTAPEEVVRQALLRHLESLGIPRASLRAEFPLCSLDPLVEDRADVVAFTAQGDQMRPVLLAECKAPHVPLTEAVEAQVRRYLRLLPATWVVITNGHEMRTWKLAGEQWVRTPLVSWEAMKAA